MIRRNLSHRAHLGTLLLLLAAAPNVRAKDFLWAETTSTVSMDLPAGWTNVSKSYGEKAFTWLIRPESGKRAEMTLSLLQFSSTGGETEKQLEAHLSKKVTQMLKPGQGYNMIRFSTRQGLGRMSQFNRDALAADGPADINHPILRVAYCSLDANCCLMSIMQMDDANSPEAVAMVDIVSSTVLTRHKPSTFLDVSVKEDHYVLTVPAGELRLNMPKGDLVPRDAPAIAATVSPRYFSFIDIPHGFQVSGWFENAHRYEGIKGFWTGENVGDRLKAKHVSFEKCGDWDVVYYESSDGQQPAIRAEYVRADTWMDLHCSIVGAATKPQAKQALLDFVRSLSVEMKEPSPVISAAPKLDSQHLAELKAALADLTANIEQTDDSRFHAALETMTLALSGLDPAQFNCAEDCVVWGQAPPHAPRAYGFLTVALVSAITQERIFGDPSLALYRGWKNVIKYYQHYHADGSLPKIAPIEKLIAEDTAGRLQEEARKLQALHPDQFDRMEL